MKTRLILLLLVIPTLASSQTWDYPIKPETEEWPRIASGEERLKLCQIPDYILAKISIDELAKLCIRYPLFYEYTTFNDDREAISLIINKFNGLKALSERKDGAIALMQIYNQMEIQEEEGYVEKGEYNSVLHFEYIELLLSSEPFINQLNEEKQRELRGITILKYGGKLSNISIYGISGIKKSLLLSSVIMNKINPSNRNSQLLNDFISCYNFADSKQLELISKINTQIDE